MIAEAIKKIEDMALDGKDVSIVPLKSEPKGKYLIIKSDGTYDERTPDVAYHAEKLATPAELAKFIDASESSGDAPVLFYDERRVVYVDNLDDRRDRATCDLILSPQFKTLQELAGPKGTMNQRDFVRLLRIDLAGCLGGIPNLLPMMRNLKFDLAAQNAANLQHGRESMGRSIELKVTGLENGPEEFPIDLPVYENHPFVARVMVALEIQTAEQRFNVTPYPLELKRAVDEALASVVETLTEGGDAPPIYRGSPE